MTAQELIQSEIERIAREMAARYGEEDPGPYFIDAKHELRDSYDDQAVGIDSWGYSRHYECEPVVKKIGDKYVCWLYWSGGGKHGEPQSVTWIDDAIIVEEGPPIMQKTFKKPTTQGE